MNREFDIDSVLGNFNFLFHSLCLSVSLSLAHICIYICIINIWNLSLERFSFACVKYRLVN